jgi:hypothetical protein
MHALLYFFTPFGISAQKTEIVCTISIVIFYEIVATLTPIMCLASVYCDAAENIVNYAKNAGIS